MKLRNLINILLCLPLPLIASCGTSGTKDTSRESCSEIPDTLHAVTLYGPTSYFNYRGQEMGFDYENLRQFAEDEGMVLDLRVAPSLQMLMQLIASGEAQLAAYPIPLIDEYKKIVRYCGPREITWQVLVQPSGKGRISDVTELVGKTVYVEKDSKYHYRITNLNNELGGGIDIVPISIDTLITEDLIEMVDRREIPLTIVDSDIAELNKSYFPNLDIEMKISLDQYSSWAVGKDCDSIASSLERWKTQRTSSDMMRSIYKKYFEASKTVDNSQELADRLNLLFRPGESISPYDNLFKKQCGITGYDWELLAAIGYNESRFDNDVISWAGAKGIMQLMPSTALSMGITENQIMIPEHNIQAASRLIRHLDDALKAKVPDVQERMKFVIAAYNSGLGHIFDSIDLAAKYGLDPEIWTGNVSEAALMKSRPQYYNDPVVKNGYFRGRETVDFVDNVVSTYYFFKKLNNNRN